MKQVLFFLFDSLKQTLLFSTYNWNNLTLKFFLHDIKLELIYNWHILSIQKRDFYRQKVSFTIYLNFTKDKKTVKSAKSGYQTAKLNHDTISMGAERGCHTSDIHQR